jgi:hypothetical protein
LDELYVYNPRAILPCFVVIYRGFWWCMYVNFLLELGKNFLCNVTSWCFLFS